MTELLRVGVAILAVYRVSQLIALDDGPYEVFERFRKWTGVNAAGGSQFWHNVALMVLCPYCVGIWIALICVPLVVWPTMAGDVALLWLGIAGGQAFLEGDKDDKYADEGNSVSYSGGGDAE